MKFLKILFISLLLFSCKEKPYEIKLNTEIDSVYVEIFHTSSGEKLFSKFYPHLEMETLKLDSIKPDMYTLCLSWERSLIPHKLIRKANGQLKLDFDNRYYLIKDIYLNPDQSRIANVNLSMELDKEQLEAADQYNEVIKPQVSSKDFFLAEQFNEIYIKSDSLQFLQLKQLKTKMYEAVNNNDFKLAKAINSTLLSDSLNNLKQAYVEKEIINLATKNLSSPVTTYYIFSELLDKRNFNIFYTTFQHLIGDATKSPYYPMISRQYQKKQH